MSTIWRKYRNSRPGRRFSRRSVSTSWRWSARSPIRSRWTPPVARIGIRVGNPHGQPPVPVTADRRRIAQVITNLLSNSIKYGREGGETRIGFVDMFDRVLVEVKDDGIGIAEENIPRVFERFFRVDKSRSREQGGTGLGLAIVKHILEAHGERITLRSKLG